MKYLLIEFKKLTRSGLMTSNKIFLLIYQSCEFLEIKIELFKI
jgi:hypothetical protein